MVLLRRIVQIAKEDKRGLLEVYRPSVDRLEVRQQYGKGTHALPLPLREKWSGENEESDEESFSSGNATSSNQDEGGVYHGDDDDDDDDGKHFTACSAESCGYCGRCSY